MGAILFANVGYSQWSPTGTLLIDNKYRSGAIGIGYTTSPAFGTNKFMVTGNSYFSGNIGLGVLAPTSKLQLATGDLKLDTGKLIVGQTFTTGGEIATTWGIKSDQGIHVRGKIGIPITVQVVSQSFPGTISEIAIAPFNSAFSIHAVTGDAIFRGNSSGSMIIANEKNGNIKFETGNFTEAGSAKIQMMIDNVGNIGIGTGSTALNPLEKLAVNGLIHTKEVKVDLLNWPDYVFDKEYNLMPLSELEVAIKTSKHLPEIPSAKEVEVQGVLLGDMNKKLLQKVEELTLYIIQMNKEIELLKTQVKN